MLIVNNIFKSYGPNIVLNDVSFGLNKGLRAGLVGTNGAGKSTLLRILAGIETADSGRLTLSPSTVVGYLPQNLPRFVDQTIGELILISTGGIRDMEARLRQIEQAMETAAGELLARLTDEYSRLSVRFQESGGYEIDYRIASVLEGLGIGCLERSRLVETLSSGEKTRVNLAMLLLKTPDLLLLDEPTNNLDLRSLAWLEAYLGRYQGAVLTASHDRQFLNNTVDVIFEIDEHSHQLKRYAGDYDAYKAAKEADRVRWEGAYRVQQEEISELRKRIKSASASTRNAGRPGKSRDNDKFIRYFKGQRLQTSASRSIRDAEERLSRILKDPVPKPPKPLRFKAGIKPQSIRSAEVIKVDGIFKSFGSRNVLSGLTFSLRYDSRIVITGPNGAGKTTLLRIIAARDTADKGEVTCAPNVRIGFLPQEPDLSDQEKTLLESYSQGLTGYEEDFIFGLVTCGLFRHEELKKKVGQLSLGQVRKLQIARMIAGEPNVLILDEPTNHISLDVLESFEAAVADFQGPVIAVSHDRRFIRQFAGDVWELSEGKLVNKGKIEY